MKKTLPLMALLCLFLNIAKAQTWEPVSVGDMPIAYYFVSMSVLDENIVWAACIDENYTSPVGANHLIKILRTTDGGQTWQLKNVEEAIGRITWDIHAIDSMTAWISSNRLEASDTRPLFKTTDGGDTWEKVELVNMSGGVFVHFFTPQKGLVIRNSRAAVTNDGGDTWTPLTAQNWPILSNESLTFWNSAGTHNAYVGSHAWAGTDVGRVLHSADYGLTWTAVQVGLTSETVNNVAFSDTLHGVATVTDNGGTPYTNTKLYETFDGGLTWSQGATAPIKRVTTLASVPGAANTFMTANGYGGNITPTTIAWNQSGITANTWVYDAGFYFRAAHIEFTSPTSGYAAGYNSNGTNIILKWNGDLTPVSSSREKLLSDIEISAFPSPFTEALTVQVDFEKPTTGTLEVHDLTGRQIFSQYIDNQQIWNKTIATQGWAAGAYLLKVRTEDGLAVRKVLKQ